MAIPNYRVILSFDGERKVFTARAPELDHCFAEGATRGEAITKLEQEIEALIHNMGERGKGPPPVIDEQPFSGELGLRVSKALHRDLTWQARVEGIELNQLASELLSAGLEGRRHLSRPPRERRPEMAPDNAGNQREYYAERERGRGGQGYGGRYHNIMEDRGSFIEYVRGLESDAGRGNGRVPRPERGDRGPDRGDRGDRTEGRNHRRRRGRPGGPGPGPQRAGGPPQGNGNAEGRGAVPAPTGPGTPGGGSSDPTG